MRKLSLSRAWEETRAVIAHDGRLLASVALALVFLPQVLMSVVGPPPPLGGQASLQSRIVYVLVILCGLSAQISVNRLAIGPSITVGGAIGRGFGRLLPLLLAFLALVVALLLFLVLVGAVLGVAGLVPPGVEQSPPASMLVVLIVLLSFAFVFAIFQLVIPIAAAEPGGPLHLFARSWELARGNYLRLLAFTLLIFVLLAVAALAGRVALGSVILTLFGPSSPWNLSALMLGILSGIIQAAFTVASAVMLARIYVQLAGGGGIQPTVPRSGI